jgi:hypothetical protein
MARRQEAEGSLEPDIVDAAFAESVWDLSSQVLSGEELTTEWEENYPVEKDRFVLTQEDQQVIYRFLRDRENDKHHFPFGIYLETWEKWISDKFYLTQSRIIYEGAVRCMGLFSKFHFIPGDFVLYEGTIRNFDLGSELPDDMLEKIAFGNCLHVHSTDFECYIVGDQGNY